MIIPRANFKREVNRIVIKVMDDIGFPANKAIRWNKKAVNALRSH